MNGNRKGIVGSRCHEQERRRNVRGVSAVGEEKVQKWLKITELELPRRNL